MRRIICGSSTAVREPVIACMCGSSATAFLQVHAVDKCLRTKTASQFFCASCLLDYLHIAQEIADDGGEYCSTCNLHIVSLADIVVRICHIDKG